MKRLLQTLLASFAVAAAAVPARALDPVNPELPPTIEVRSGGLQTSLILSAYTVTTNVPVLLPAELSFPPILGRTSISASAILQNRSSSAIPFTFPDAASASRKWTFRLFNAAGAKLWQSDADAAGDPPSVEAQLRRYGRWRRTVQIPLVLNNAPLAAGVYTVEASVDADKQVGATSLFEVTQRTPPQPDPKLTGIKGRVTRITGSPGDPTAPPEEVPVAGASIVVTQLLPPNSAGARAPFTWRGVTNADGRFEVNTPASRFTVTATLPPGPEANPLPPPQKTAEVVVQAGRFSEVKFVFPANPGNATGIRGLVQQESPNGGPPTPAAHVRVTVTELPNLSQRPSFEWEGRTDAQGRFLASVPAGSYRVTAHPTSIGVLPVVPPPVSKDVTVEMGVITEVVLLLPARPTPQPNEALIYVVHDVSLTPGDAHVTVTARGSVPSGGWKNPRLRPRNTNSGSGMAEFDFVAQPPPPGAPVTQAVVTFTASTTVERTADFRGVRVYARTNRKEAELPR